MSKPQPNSPETWPVVWRVVAPGAGSFDHDMTFLSTEDEAEARSMYRSIRAEQWCVRLERVQCGPLPKDAERELTELRATNPQNPDTSLRPVDGFWEAGGELLS
jgi:hypothetical protein